MTQQIQDFDKLSQMTIEEKASLLCGATFFGTRGISRLGIPELKMLDGGTGMNYEQLLPDRFKDLTNGYTGVEFDNVIKYFFEENRLSAREIELHKTVSDKLTELLGVRPSPGCYPPGIFLASTWDREVIYEVGEALGLEASLYGLSILLGTPNINILRDARNGRFFEGYSEDPYITGELGSELVKGVQSQGVAANIKHFAANNLEINRIGINQIISERALREIYFPAFKKCVEEGAQTVMAAYPKINGKNCTENHWLLYEVLRNEWGFDGLVMTDWNACTGKERDSVASGVDLIMPGPWKYEDIIEAIKDGSLSEERLNEAASAVLAISDKYYKAPGLPNGITLEDYISIGDKAAYDAAKSGIVMLKNKDKAFPVKDNTGFILFGNFDGYINDCGSGSAQVFTDRKHSIKEYLNVTGVEDIALFASDPNSVALVIYTQNSAEGSDREDIKLPIDIEEIINGLAGIRRMAKGRAGKIALVLNTPSPVELDSVIDNLDGLFCVYYPGMMGPKALADILTGKVNPSGKLTVTFPHKYEDTPAYLNYPDGYKVIYGEDIFVGYRGYEKRGVKPLFPFGFGLSYTDFKLSDIRLSKDKFFLSDEVEVKFNLTNCGQMDGSTVVQLYIGDPHSIKNKPIKELRAFNKYHLKAGQSKEYSLKLKITDLASYDEDYKKFLVEDGSYDVYLGFDSNARKCATFYVNDGCEEYALGINSTVQTISEIPELYEALCDNIKTLGFELQTLINCKRYTPFFKISKIYENANELKDFTKKCMEYIKP